MNNVSFMKLTAAPTSLDRATPSVALKPPVDRTLLTPALQQPVQRDSREAVRKLSHQLEAVFVNQLFQAMRASVPKDPILGNAPGAEMFTQICSPMPARCQHLRASSLCRTLLAHCVRGVPVALVARPNKNILLS